MANLDFFRGRRVFLTGHTGFIGTWLSRVLIDAGAEVTGYSLPAADPSLFRLADVNTRLTSVFGDVRDLDALQMAFHAARPEVVFHLAAQPIVREGYRDPHGTYETNIMGTVNILECIRSSRSVLSFLNVTTDKVYENDEREFGYRETDTLNGLDPYSNSKSCSELVTHAYRRSYFALGRPPISTARVGNVIGGGDFARDRIIPDCVRAAAKGEPILVRNPDSVRPYQHVLEPLFAYLMIVQRQCEEPGLAGWFNIGPNASEEVTTKHLVTMFCEAWGDGLAWVAEAETDPPHETNCLRLDSSRVKAVLGWRPHWGTREAVQRTVDWTKAWLSGSSPAQVMTAQIKEFLQ